MIEVRVVHNVAIADFINRVLSLPTANAIIKDFLLGGCQLRGLKPTLSLRAVNGPSYPPSFSTITASPRVPSHTLHLIASLFPFPRASLRPHHVCLTSLPILVPIFVCSCARQQTDVTHAATVTSHQNTDFLHCHWILIFAEFCEMLRLC